MCFGSSSKGEDPSSHLPAPRIAAESSKPQRNSIKMPQRETYAPPSGPPPSHQQSYDAPPGPPPSHQQSYAYEAPPGPPPSHSQSAEEYAPPPGPPPNFYSNDYAAPPPGPPPSHDWQSAVPDTSLLPPPPSLGNQRSSTNNATEQEAEQGESWCQQNPLRAPLSLPYDVLQAQVVQALQRGDIGIIKPRAYNGSLERARAGVWTGKTKSNSPDSCITSTIPLYSVQAHSPLTTRISKTIYYEVRIARNNRREVSLALGFAAPPYPTFRLPGWHRGCLAVHGDDGSKFINDRWGGKDFTQPFKAGQTLGVGMTFTARDVNAPPAYSDGPSKPQTSVQTPIDVEIFFTRDGRKDGGWNLHEEGDAVEDLPVTGLEGFHDLYAAVGTFEAVDFEIVFNEREWMYHP